MPAATVAGSVSAAGASSSSQHNSAQGQVPFLVGSNEYAEQITKISHQIKPNEGQEYVINITPGGFLRGVRLLVRSRGGVLGSGNVTSDNPWNLFSSINLENVDGSPIKYSMSGYAYYLENKWLTPWEGDPSLFDNFEAGINPSFDLRVFAEIRDSLAVLANTDARSQYRLRFTVAPGHHLATGNVSTWPTVEIECVLETWAQTDSQDLSGHSIAALPPGISAGSILRHDVIDLHAGGASNLIQMRNTGNEYRGLILVTRDGKGERADLLGDPIRFRIDDRSMWTRSPDSLFALMRSHYQFLNMGISEREKGVYVIPFFRNPGTQGSYWRPTSNATFVLIEANTAPGAKNLPGTCEVVTGEVVPVGQIPPHLEGI